MDIFLLYLFTRADVVSDVFQFIMFISFVVMVFAVIFSLTNDKGGAGKTVLLYAKRLALAAVSFCLLYMVTPRQKDLAIIVGGHFAIEAAQSDTAKKIYTIVQGALDEQIAEIAKKRAGK